MKGEKTNNDEQNGNTLLAVQIHDAFSKLRASLIGATHGSSYLATHTYHSYQSYIYVCVQFQYRVAARPHLKKNNNKPGSNHPIISLASKYKRSAVLQISSHCRTHLRSNPRNAYRPAKILRIHGSKCSKTSRGTASFQCKMRAGTFKFIQTCSKYFKVI